MYDWFKLNNKGCALAAAGSPQHLTFNYFALGVQVFVMKIMLYCWAPWISQVISPGHPYFLRAWTILIFKCLICYLFFPGHLCEDDDQGGRNVFWTPWIRAGLNLFWKIQGSENSVMQLYIPANPRSTKIWTHLEIFCIARISFLTMSELHSPKITRRPSKCFLRR